MFIPTSGRCLFRLTLLTLVIAVLLLVSVNVPSPSFHLRRIQNFLSSDLPVSPTPPPRNYTILIWKHGKRMLRRFLRSYGSVERDPFSNCPVRNCQVRIDEKDLNISDAVMFHLHQTRGPHELPRWRPPDQRWIFFTDESPMHTFLLNPRAKMKDFNGLFNWSMTYRADSDIPVPYGRTVLRRSVDGTTTRGAEPNFAQMNTKLVAILGSNCGGKNYRWQYVREMQKHIPVDIFGGCGTLKCPGHFTKDCTPLTGYKFYLAFENSNCQEYMTEKLWWNAYAKNSVPVIMGAPKDDVERLCPPDSFIHVEDFANPEELAKYLLELNGNETAYNALFDWKRDYEVLNEHGYFGTPTMHLCRICETLNLEGEPKIYDKLEGFWNKDVDCSPPKWTPKRT